MFKMFSFSTLTISITDHALLQAIPDVEHMLFHQRHALFASTAAAAFLPKCCSQPDSDLDCRGNVNFIK